MQRLGKNIGGYFGEAIDIRALLKDVATAAQLHGWTSEAFHQAGGFDYIACRREPLSNTKERPARRVYISTGIHGDEPAGPLAALRLLREDLWPPHLDLWLLPCLNPIGFTLNRRENGEGKDLNRDYLHRETAEVRAHIAWLENQPMFDVSLCLHEDWESHGFYIYELNPDNRPTLAIAIVDAVSKVCPVDPSELIEGRPAKEGIIRPDIDPRIRPQWPEAFWLLTYKTRLSYTLEAPSDFSLATRVDSLIAGVNAALKALDAAG